MVSIPNIARRDRGILGMLAIVFATMLGAALFAQTAARPTADPEVYVHPDLRRAAEAARQGRFLMPATTSPGAPAAVQRTVPGPKGAPDVDMAVTCQVGKTFPSSPPPVIVLPFLSLRSSIVPAARCSSDG
jgi:hypothetical protein